MVCLYVLFIQLGFIICDMGFKRPGCSVCGVVVGLVKVYHGFRFEPALYAAFKAVLGGSGFTVTGAFERFMQGCVDVDALVFAERRLLDFEVEARILVDWLGKGKLFYRADGGDEVNISGRLLWLLPKVNDASLKGLIEEALKKSVTEKP
jgi:hypothetical protein